MFSVYQKTLASPMYVNFWGQDSLSKASVLSTKSSAEEANRTEQSEISNGNEPDVVVLSGEGIKVSESLQKEKIDEVNQQLELDLSRYERLSVLSRDYLRYKGEERYSSLPVSISRALGKSVDTTGYPKPLESIDYSDPSVRLAHCRRMSIELAAVEPKRTQKQEQLALIDEKIAKILESNNINLGKNETLNFSVDQDGKITVSNGVSEDKRKSIEELFNKDEMLGYDLLLGHVLAARLDVVFGTETKDNKIYHNQESISSHVVISAILKREYGISLSDLELISTDERYPDPDVVPITGSDAETNAVLEKLYAEDANFFTGIQIILRDRANGNNYCSYERGFSYQNGVTIEKGVGDQAGLDKRYGKVASQSANGPQKKILNIFNAYSEPTDDSNETDNTEIITKSPATRLRAAIFEKYKVGLTTPIENNTQAGASPQPILKQFAYEKERLLRFQGENVSIVLY